MSFITRVIPENDGTSVHCACQLIISPHCEHSYLTWCYMHFMCAHTCTFAPPVNASTILRQATIPSNLFQKNIWYKIFTR